MSVNVNELRQELGKAVEELRSLQNDCDNRGGESAEDAEKFAKMEKQISGLEKRIKYEEFLADKEAELAVQGRHFETGEKLKAARVKVR